MSHLEQQGRGSLIKQACHKKDMLAQKLANEFEICKSYAPKTLNDAGQKRGKQEPACSTINIRARRQKRSTLACRDDAYRNLSPKSSGCLCHHG